MMNDGALAASSRHSVIFAFALTPIAFHFSFIISHFPILPLTHPAMSASSSASIVWSFS